MSDSGHIWLVLEARVLAGGRADLEAFLREARPYYESIGDTTMHVMWDAQDDHRFREIFEYHTREAYEADDHRVKNDPEMQTYLKRWRALLDGEISVTVWNSLPL